MGTYETIANGRPSDIEKFLVSNRMTHLYLYPGNASEWMIDTIRLLVRTVPYTDVMLRRKDGEYFLTFNTVH